MRALFEGCTAFNQSLESWDLRHLQSMSRMFYGCINFNGSVQGWNVSNVQYMDRMLEGCIAFDQTLASWTPSSIKGEIGLKQCGMSVENYSITLIEWASKIAQLPKNVTVDAQGLVYASKAADARNALVAKLWSFNGDVLEGTPVPLQGITLVPLKLEMNVGDTRPITVRYIPKQATNRNVTWSVVPSHIATVDDQGRMTALKPGSADITATSQDGGHLATCKLVANAVPLTGIDLQPKTLSLRIGETKLLTVLYTPANATEKGITWSSENDDIATVDTEGRVTGRGKGVIEVSIKS